MILFRINEPPERRQNKQCKIVVLPQDSNLQPLDYRSTALHYLSNHRIDGLSEKYLKGSYMQFFSLCDLKFFYTKTQDILLTLLNKNFWPDVNHLWFYPGFFFHKILLFQIPIVTVQQLLAKYWSILVPSRTFGETFKYIDKFATMQLQILS